MPTIPYTRRAYKKRRAAKLKRLKKAWETVFQTLQEWDWELESPLPEKIYSYPEVLAALNYIMRQARKAV